MTLDTCCSFDTIDSDEIDGNRVFIVDSDIDSVIIYNDYDDCDVISDTTVYQCTIAELCRIIENQVSEWRRSIFGVALHWFTAIETNAKRNYLGNCCSRRSRTSSTMIS